MKALRCCLVFSTLKLQPESPMDQGEQPPDRPNPYSPPIPEGGPEIAPPQIVGPRLNPWISIWTKPRATIRQIVATGPRNQLVLLAALYGAASGIRNGANGAGNTLHLAKTFDDRVGFAVAWMLLGAVLGLLMWLLVSWLAKLTAGWLGGHSNLRNMRAAYAWGQSPGIWTIPISLLIFLVTGGKPQAVANPGLLALICFGIFANLVIGLWNLITLSKCIGEVSGFSAWLGFAAFVMAWMLVFLPLIISKLVVDALAMV